MWQECLVPSTLFTSLWCSHSFKSGEFIDTKQSLYIRMIFQHRWKELFNAAPSIVQNTQVSHGSHCSNPPMSLEPQQSATAVVGGEDCFKEKPIDVAVVVTHSITQQPWMMLWYDGIWWCPVQQPFQVGTCNMHVGSAAFKYIHQENSSKNVRTCRFYVVISWC